MKITIDIFICLVLAAILFISDAYIILAGILTGVIFVAFPLTIILIILGAFLL